MLLHDRKEFDKRMFLNPIRFDSLTVYETKMKVIVVGASSTEPDVYRILKIENELGLSSESDLSQMMMENSTDLSKVELDQTLNMLHEGNKPYGGLKKLCDSCGWIGFVQFTEGYYGIFITKSSVVGLLGGHLIRHVDEVQMVPFYSKSDGKQNNEEQRLCDTFLRMDLTKNFYYSCTYDLTNTFQRNSQNAFMNKTEENSMFVWNHYLREKFSPFLSGQWFVSLIYGFVDEASRIELFIFGKTVFVLLIARRSRHYAGTRYLRRGLSSQGFVANEVETEQIVYDGALTSLGMGKISSLVQHRGSIPLIWSQDAIRAPKPPIHCKHEDYGFYILVNIVDPFYHDTAVHFKGLMKRYGAPICALNLVKLKEKTARESLLAAEYARAISYLNQFLSADTQIHYVSWDMARAAKSRDQDVIAHLESIAYNLMEKCLFYYKSHDKIACYQKGIIRTNCIDCLDRTNAAQFIIGKCGFAFQLQQLGVIQTSQLDFDCDASRVLMELYHDHGDTIALQYGGSFLVNTMQSYKKNTSWSSHSRDLINSIKRFYSNSFTDAEKQESMNLFLGVDKEPSKRPMMKNRNQ